MTQKSTPHRGAALTLKPLTAPLVQARWGLLPAALLPLAAFGNPTGGTVVAGQASIGSAGSVTTIQQQSGSAVINWQQFGIGAGETVQFLQPSASAAVLNRVIGGNASEILGNLSANGRVFLINPQGVMFGAGARVDVGGLVASTLDIANDDFMAGRYVLAGEGGSVRNDGVLTARDGGFVVLAGGDVQNGGLIQTRLGDVVLASGSGITLDLNDTGLVSYQIDAAALSDVAGVANTGALMADGGRVFMAANVARDLAATAVNNSGVVRATGISEHNGVIVLEASGGHTVNSGSLDASSANGNGGSVQVLSDADVLVTGGTVDASGATGGGSIRIGGGWQGGEGLTEAARTYVAPSASVAANATVQGAGGRIAVWSADQSVVHGSLSAQGAGTGHGGAVETSSHGVLTVSSSPNIRGGELGGEGGHWLIDPYNIRIVGTGNVSVTELSPGVFAPEATGNITSELNVGTLLEALSGGATVTVQTGFNNDDGSGQAGDLTLATTLDYAGTGNGTLNLIAFNNINIQGSVLCGDGCTGDSLNLNLRSGVLADGVTPSSTVNGNIVGNINFNGSSGNPILVVTNGGNFSAVTAESGGINFNGDGNIALNTATGSLALSAGTAGLVRSNSGLNTMNGNLVNVSSAGGISLSGVSISGVSGVVVKGNAQDDLEQSITLGTITALGGDITITNNGNGGISTQDLFAGSAIDDGNIVVTGGSITISNAATDAAADPVFPTLSLGNISAQGDVTIIAGSGSVEQSGDLRVGVSSGSATEAVGGDVIVSATTGNIVLGTLLSNADETDDDLSEDNFGRLEITSGGNLSVNNFDNLGPRGLSAESVAITILGSGPGTSFDVGALDLRATGAEGIEITATGGINFLNTDDSGNISVGSLFAEGGAIKLATNGDVTVGELDAAGAIKIAGVTAGSGTGFVRTGSIETSAVNGVGNTSDGSVFIQSNSGININGSVTTSAVTNGAGLESGTANASFTATIDNTTSGDSSGIFVNGPISTQALVGYLNLRDGISEDVGNPISGAVTADAGVRLSNLKPSSASSDIRTGLINTTALAATGGTGNILGSSALGEININNAFGSIRIVGDDGSPISTNVRVSDRFTPTVEQVGDAAFARLDALSADGSVTLRGGSSGNGGVFLIDISEGDQPAPGIRAYGLREANTGPATGVVAFNSTINLAANGSFVDGQQQQTVNYGVQTGDLQAARGDILVFAGGDITVGALSGDEPGFEDATATTIGTLQLSAGGEISSSALTEGSTVRANQIFLSAGGNLNLADVDLDAISGIDLSAGNQTTGDLTVGNLSTDGGYIAVQSSGGGVTTGDINTAGGDLFVRAFGGNGTTGSLTLGTEADGYGLLSVSTDALLRIGDTAVAQTIRAREISLKAGSDGFDPEDDSIVLGAIDQALLSLVSTNGNIDVSSQGSITLGSLTSNFERDGTPVVIDSGDFAGSTLASSSYFGGSAAIGVRGLGDVNIGSVSTNASGINGAGAEGYVSVSSVEGSVTTGSISTNASGSGFADAWVDVSGSTVTINGAINTRAVAQEGVGSECGADTICSSQTDSAQGWVFLGANNGGVLAGDITTQAVVVAAGGSEAAPGTSLNRVFVDAAVDVNSSGSSNESFYVLQTGSISTSAAGFGTPAPAPSPAPVEECLECFPIGEFAVAADFSDSSVEGGIRLNTQRNAEGSAFGVGAGITVNGGLTVSVLSAPDASFNSDISAIAYGGDLTINGPIQAGAAQTVRLVTRNTVTQGQQGPVEATPAGNIVLLGPVGTALTGPGVVDVESGAGLSLADVYANEVDLYAVGDIASSAQDGHIRVTSLTGDLAIQSFFSDGNIFVAGNVFGRDIELNAAQLLQVSGVLDTRDGETGALGSVTLSSGFGVLDLEAPETLDGLSASVIYSDDMSEDFSQTDLIAGSLTVRGNSANLGENRSFDGDLTIETTTGSLQTAGVSTTGNLSLIAATDLTASGLHEVGGNSSLSATGTLSLSEFVGSSEGSTTLSAGQNLQLITSDVFAETASLSSGGDLFINGSGIEANTDITVNAAGLVKIEAQSELYTDNFDDNIQTIAQPPAEPSTLSITGGTVEVTQSLLEATTFSLTATGPQGATISDSFVVYDSGTFTASTGDLSVSSTAIAGGAHSLNAAGAINLTAIRSLLADPMVQSPDQATVTAGFSNYNGAAPNRVRLSADSVRVANSTLATGDLTVLGTSSIVLDNTTIDGAISYLSADSVSSTGAVTLDTDALTVLGRVINLGNASLVVGRGTALDGSDFGLPAALLPDFADLVPSVSAPNASIVASESLTLGSLVGTASYIVLSAPLASLPQIGAVSGASDLFLQFSPTAGEGDYTFTLADLAFANSAATFAFGSSDYQGAITITDPAAGAVQAIVQPKALTANGNNTNYIFLTSGLTTGAQPLQDSTSGQVAVLGPTPPAPTPPAPTPPAPTPPAPTPPAPTPPAPTPPAPTPPAPTPPSPTPTQDPLAELEDFNRVLLEEQLVPEPKVKRTQSNEENEAIITHTVELPPQQCSAL